MLGSAASIIDIAGAKLRSDLASTDSMLVFAVWRAPYIILHRDLVGNGTKGLSHRTEPHILPHCPCTIRGDLVGKVTRSVHPCVRRSTVLFNVRQRQARFRHRTRRTHPSQQP